MTNDNSGIWVLGYGSLIYKPPPHYTHRIPAVIHGFVRRFWQSSTDHRGTPENPGRVATLIPYEEILSQTGFLKNVNLYSQSAPIQGPDDLITIGIVYYIPGEHAEKVRGYLDIREQNGYTLHQVEVHLETNREHEAELGEALEKLPCHDKTGKRVLLTTVYIGTVDNEAFVGPETVDETAKVIASSHGPSGSNYEYLAKLQQALEQMALAKEQRVITDHYLTALLESVNKYYK
ncbi:hypothetical protein SMKI_05G2460 [Saccharomyces mikatae IFO 1815]|uniref:glutathione-specific gamma-glutamylcyclotransferase n=1 Tax=Saccharomyces mikatae IFO 1815 TaxID=226126 RepID=A0AA35IZZ2_SACMI|nr:uncharacterized protein SMKI_05G2460 [Saccharomyces mikatae IFO 1815]CAI4038632.1 hypothetical protein SMKI_05G2460 [Saccharomyces mikatae IFO 1815]